MANEAVTKARVVDLLQFKEERRQQALDFGEDRGPRPAGLAPIQPFRTLTEREIAHRQRMVGFLAESRKA